MIKVLITGAQGFIGKNLCQSFSESPDIQVICFDRSHKHSDFKNLLKGVKFVFHLAGVNRPADESEFELSNIDLTRLLLEAVHSEMLRSGSPIHFVFASSIQSQLNTTPYALSKFNAEELIKSYSSSHNISFSIFRLPNVFGKWCKPNYNSVVATFCHNIARGLPIYVKDPDIKLQLVYIDDVVTAFKNILYASQTELQRELYPSIKPLYVASLAQISEQIYSFYNSRQSLIIDSVGNGFTRSLYSTYLSYLPPTAFSYFIPSYVDERGRFTEMLKTRDSGQFSFFTALPGVTRGGHYHHSKTEKFLVIQGQALFRFRNIQSGHTHEISTSGTVSQIVETVPGWTHDITNVGSDDLIVMLWANEIFNRDKPDTYASPL